jgi:hypothetical protein
MKSFIILLITALGIQSAINAQFSHLKDVKLETTKDFQDNTEQVFDCSNYILLTPYDKKDDQRIAATEFVYRWINNSPKYTFTVSNKVKLLTDEREDLLALYSICYALFSLENKDIITTVSEKENYAIDALINYCGNPINKIKLTKEIKKLIDLKAEGEITSATEYYNLPQK